MNFNIIVAGCETNIANILGIGFNNQIPWHLREDIKLFRKYTLNNVVIMGRKTWQSISPPLSKRIKIVLTSKKNIKCSDSLTFFVSSLEGAFKKASEYNKEIFVIGGAEIYNEALKMQNNIKRIYLTTIYQNYCCDRFIDTNFIKNYTLVHKDCGVEKKIKFCFEIYEAKKYFS